MLIYRLMMMSVADVGTTDVFRLRPRSISAAAAAFWLLSVAGVVAVTPSYDDRTSDRDDTLNTEVQSLEYGRWNLIRSHDDRKKCEKYRALKNRVVYAK